MLSESIKNWYSMELRQGLLLPVRKTIQQIFFLMFLKKMNTQNRQRNILILIWKKF